MIKIKNKIRINNIGYFNFSQDYVEYVENITKILDRKYIVFKK